MSGANLRLSPEKSLVNDCVRAILGRSSATTTHVRTQDRVMPLAFNAATDPPRPLVQSSITPDQTYKGTNKLPMLLAKLLAMLHNKLKACKPRLGPLLAAGR